MSGANLQHLAAMIVYMAAVIGIGLYFSKRANKNAEAYFLGGRSLGPWVTAFSAEASDMSGCLLMGIPGLAYWTGLADAGWTCIGLALGTYFNFLIVSKRLRRYSIAVNAFTIPDFFSNRFHEKKKVLMSISSVIIIIFFAVYAAQCLTLVRQAVCKSVRAVLQRHDDRCSGIRAGVHISGRLPRGERVGLHAGGRDDHSIGADSGFVGIRCGRHECSNRQCQIV